MPPFYYPCTYYILYTIHYILYTIYYILYTIYYILYTIYYILYTCTVIVVIMSTLSQHRSSKSLKYLLTSPLQLLQINSCCSRKFDKMTNLNRDGCSGLIIPFTVRRTLLLIVPTITTPNVMVSYLESTPLPLYT